MPDLAASVVWIDANGRTRQTIVKTLAGSAALVAALAAASNAVVQQSWESAILTPGGVAVASPYQTVGDTARLVFQTGIGGNIRLTLVSPSLSIFLPDGITVDPANALVAAVVASAVGSLSDGSGNAVVSYLGGYYSRVRGTDLLTP